MERLDLTPLTQRAVGERWRRFRTEARTGAHGPDLVEPNWWTRWAYPIAWVLWLLLLPVVPLAVMTRSDVGTGSRLLSLLAPVALAIAGLVVLGWSRAEFWSIRAPRGYRMTEFARVNGLGYEPVATPRRPKAHIFTVPPHRVHSDRFSTPHFVVGNYEEIWDDSQTETESYQHGYAVFQLRESYPRTIVARTLTERITLAEEHRPCARTGRPADLVHGTRRPPAPATARVRRGRAVARSQGEGDRDRGQRVVRAPRRTLPTRPTSNLAGLRSDGRRARTVPRAGTCPGRAQPGIHHELPALIDRPGRASRFVG